MQAALLIGIYILVAAVLQLIGAGISKGVELIWPAAGLLTFLIIFMCAYGLAWPIAVRITEFLIRRAGYTVQTEESGAAEAKAQRAAMSAGRSVAAGTAST